MENMVDALKIAFGVLVFIIAITVTFMLLSQAKSTTNVIIFMSDKTNYYDNYKGNKDNIGRIVEIDTVIASMYKAWEESYSIMIKINDEDIIIDTDTNKYASKEDFQTKVKEKVQGLINNYSNKEFIETFDNITYTGNYKIDGEEKITIAPGYTKTHITYQVQGG